MQQYLRWLDTLDLRMPLTNLFDDVRTGLLLCRILERLNPGTSEAAIDRREGDDD